MPPKKRAYGTGGISQRASDGLWIGTLEAGSTARGTRRRLRVSAKTRAECAAKLKQLDREVKAKGNPVEGVDGRATIKSWAAEWLKLTERELRPTTWKTNKGCIDKWIVHTIGQRRLGQLTPHDIRAVQDAQYKAGLKASSVLRTHSVLIKMLKTARREGHPVPDAVVTSARPKKNESDRKAIPVSDIHNLIAAAGTFDDGSRWLTALFQGLRQSEALGLTWGALDLDTDQPTADISWQLQQLPYADRAAGKFRVPAGFTHRRVYKSLHLVRPKTEKGQRVIPLVPPVAAALREWRSRAPANEAGLVWPTLDGTPRTKHVDLKQWQQVQDAAGIRHESGRGYYIHELRHSCATLLLMANVDITVTKAIMGHSAMTTTQGYQHASQELARRGLDAAVKMLGSA